MYINQCNITDNKPRNKYEIFSLKEIPKKQNFNIKKNTKKTQRKEINFCGIVIPVNKHQELLGIRFL